VNAIQSDQFSPLRIGALNCNRSILNAIDISNNGGGLQLGVRLEVVAVPVAAIVSHVDIEAHSSVARETIINFVLSLGNKNSFSQGVLARVQDVGHLARNDSIGTEVENCIDTVISAVTSISTRGLIIGEESEGLLQTTGNNGSLAVSQINISVGITSSLQSGLNGSNLLSVVQRSINMNQSNEELAACIYNASESAENLCYEAGLGRKLQAGAPLGQLVHKAAEILGVDLSGSTDSGFLPEEQASPARKLRGAVAAGRELCIRADLEEVWEETCGEGRALVVFAAGAKLQLRLRDTSATVRSCPQGPELSLETLCRDDVLWATVFERMDVILCNAVTYQLSADATREDFLQAYLAASPCDLICG